MTNEEIIERLRELAWVFDDVHLYEKYKELREIADILEERL